MLKKKVWKRGDKLNAKELNRIEKGTTIVVTADEDVTNGGSGVFTFSNWSISPENFKTLAETTENIHFQFKGYSSGEYKETYHFYSMQVEGEKYICLGFVSGFGLIKAVIEVDKDTNLFVVNINVLMPDNMTNGES